MKFPGIARRAYSAAAPAPIKGYSRRGFVIGWVAIICLAAAGYALAASQLSPSSAELRLAQTGQSVQPVLSRT